MAAIARLTSRLCGIVNNKIPIKYAPTIITSLSNTGRQCNLMQNAFLRTRVAWIPKYEAPQQTIIEDVSETEEKLTNEIVSEINNQVANKTTSRLFAIIHLCGKQFKVTDNDLIVVQGYWPPTSGDKIKLEKVLLLGSTDFTLVGRPMLNRDLVNIDATIIEKTMSHTKTHFRYKKRKQFRRIHFRRSEHTVIRINSITINRPINELQEVEGLDKVY